MRLDKYKIKNKNSKFFGHDVWLTEEASEDNNFRAQFILDSCVKIRMKMSSVEFVSAHFPVGYKFLYNGYQCEIASIATFWPSYRIKSNAYVYGFSLRPWQIPNVGAKVV